jgi:short-subunit dehydrogenase
MPGLSSYCGTKALVSNFGEALSFEVREYMDVLVWDCGHVDTKLVKDGPTNCFTMTPAGAVSGMLTHVGKTRRTRGNFRHKLSEKMVLGCFWISCCGRKAADSIRASYNEKNTKFE